MWCLCWSFGSAVESVEFDPFVASALDMRMTPVRETVMPASLTHENRSTWNRAPKTNVKMEEVAERIVTEATEVYSKQAEANQFAYTTHC